MGPQLMEGGKDDGGTDEEHGFVLQGSHDDFVRSADAVNIGRAVGDGEIAGIDHAQIDVQSFPELLGAPGAGAGAFDADLIGPTLADAFAAFDVFAAIFVEAADVGFEPGIEDGDSHGLKELTDAIAPAELFFSGAGGDKIHGAGEINAGALQ